MALDYGRRRIGVAATDPSRTIAAPHSVVKNVDPPTEPPGALLGLLDDLDPSVVLVGIPVDMDGREGLMASEAKKFCQRLAVLSDRPIFERDERLSSHEADEMLRDMELPRRRRREKGLRDMLAATVILREYIEEEPVA